MKEIEITEENYEIYKKFNELANPSKAISSFSTFASNKVKNIWGILSILSVVVPFFTLGSIYITLFDASLVLLSTIFTFIVCPINMNITNKIIRKMNVKTFQKEYPNFDIELDVKEIEKALKKYKELSKTPKNIEEKKKEHLTNLPEEVEKMSTQEKLAYLEQEKEFWEQVAVQEKYQNLEEQIEQAQIKKYQS